MSICKETPTRLRKMGDTYVTLPSSTLSKISNPDALAVLCYLLDKPIDWTPRRSDIMKRFSIGRTRYDAAMKHLKDVGLAWVQVERSEDGRILDRYLTVGATPLEDHLRSENVQLGRKPTSRLIHHEDNQTTTHNRGFKQVQSNTQGSTRKRTLEQDLTDTTWADS